MRWLANLHLSAQLQRSIRNFVEQQLEKVIVPPIDHVTPTKSDFSIKLSPPKTTPNRVEVKPYIHDNELWVLNKREGRQQKEIALQRRRLVCLLLKLRPMRRSLPSRDRQLIRIEAAKKEAGSAFRFVKIRVPTKDQPVTRDYFLIRTWIKLA